MAMIYRANHPAHAVRRQLIPSGAFHENRTVRRHRPSRPGHPRRGVVARLRGRRDRARSRAPRHAPRQADRRHRRRRPAGWLDAAHGSDAVIASLSARRDGNNDSVPAAARTLLDNLPKAGVRRLLWVGGAGSLETAPGVKVIDDPNFPAAWKPEAEAQGRALDVFRTSHADVDWTYVSPAALIEDGERSGKYRVGGDQLLVDGNGVSRI